MSDSPIALHVGEITKIVLCAPPRNEMNGPFFDALRHVALTMQSIDTRGFIVTGAARHFSSGAAIDELTARFSNNEDTPFLEHNRETFEAIANEPRPVVAAISGCCLGSGFELALACRYRIATPSALFGLVESTFGLMPGCGGAVRLAEEFGRGIATELVLKGSTFGAEDALSRKIIHAIVDKKELLSSAETLVRRLSSFS